MYHMAGGQRSKFDNISILVFLFSRTGSILQCLFSVCVSVCLCVRHKRDMSQLRPNGKAQDSDFLHAYSYDTQELYRVKFLTSEICEGHLRSKRVKNSSFWSKFRITFRDPIFSIQTYIIPLSNIRYTVLTLKAIKGHQRSNRGQIQKTYLVMQFFQNIFI